MSSVSVRSSCRRRKFSDAFRSGYASATANRRPSAALRMSFASPAAPGVCACWSAARAYLDALGAGSQESYLVRQPSALSGTAELIAQTPAPVVMDYVTLRTLDTYAPYLSKEFADVSFAFHGTTLNGTPENAPLWKLALRLWFRPLVLAHLEHERHAPHVASLDERHHVASGDGVRRVDDGTQALLVFRELGRLRER